MGKVIIKSIMMNCSFEIDEKDISEIADFVYKKLKNNHNGERKT